jgi:hypothetical protein
MSCHGGSRSSAWYQGAGYSERWVPAFRIKWLADLVPDRQHILAAD